MHVISAYVYIVYAAVALSCVLVGPGVAQLMFGPDVAQRAYGCPHCVAVMCFICVHSYICIFRLHNVCSFVVYTIVA